MDLSKIFLKDACPTSIGGQAIMEGVMMRGTDRLAIACRVPDGRIHIKTQALPPPKPIAKVPVIRGIVAFVSSLVLGMKTLLYSADVLEHYGGEEAEHEEPGRLEKWIGEKFGEKAAWNFALYLAVVVAIAIAIGVFVLLPTVVVNLLGRVVSNAFVLNLVEGVLRIALFLGYIAAISHMEEIHTVFRYHGAEHKTIHCFENGLPLTPENAQGFYTLHPRCGTSFLMFVMIISLILFSLLGWPNLLLRLVSRIVLIPLVAGLSYEVLKWAGRSDNAIVKILSLPGLYVQKLTTAEPTNEQLEVAIASVKAVLVPADTPLMEGICDKDAHLIETVHIKAAGEEEA
ncbi:MAG: DUF1385 domain-containing protein [Clostridia bacterium]|nr:DUF1385 domain-containing protein [Clostridia bacterium]